MKIRFYQDEDFDWYADLPAYLEQGGEPEELQMIAGADDLLDYLSNYGNEVILDITTEYTEGYSDLVSESDEAVGIYISDEIGSVYLCPVTEWLFGEYPKIIYYKRIK